MSNWHSLDGSIKKEAINIIFHIPIPDETNDVGESYRAALIYSEPFTTSNVPYMVGSFDAELVQLSDVELYEKKETVFFDANLTSAEKIIIIDAKWSELCVSVLADIHNKYIYWGKNQDVG